MVDRKDGLFRYKSMTDRERKNLMIMDIIRRSGPVSRTEISRITEINIVTISNYINHYIEKGFVVEKGLDISTGGRKPTLLELNDRGGYVVGVDIGPRDIRVVFTDLGVNVVTKKSIERPRGDMEEVTNSSLNLVQKVIDESKVEKEKIRGIGLGISGIIDDIAGTVRDTNNRRGKTSSSYATLRMEAEKKFNIDAFVGNDATCAAYGEKRLTIEADVENMLYIYSDVGCGIIIKGEIYSGAGGSAGEIQLAIDQTGKGDLPLPSDELYYLRPLGVDLGMVQEAKNIISKGIGTKILELAKGQMDGIALEHIIKAAHEGDKIATDLIETAGIGLGTRVAYLINLFNPEVVIIGGGIERSGELILESIKKAVRKLAFEEPASRVRILPSGLGEDAVSLGAACLVLREVFADI
ncbi:MAG: ROK family transcriptional regulator [Candidatus Omnitrophica bacterium]|nr:ROK family transcriptional regulator [Candidatus Omnitrophota bacterium]